MKTLSKGSKIYIVNLINNKENVNRIKAFCQGLGLDTENYSSPVHIGNNKITIRYRTENTYYYI
jgi:hypothetical protein